MDDDDTQVDRLRAAFAPCRARDAVARLTDAGVAAVVPVGPNMHTFMNDAGAAPTRPGGRIAPPHAGHRA